MRNMALRKQVLKSLAIYHLQFALWKKRFKAAGLNKSEDDGSYHFLTVYTEEDNHKTGGLNVDNKKFKAVEELLYGMIEEDLEDLHNEVRVIQEQGFEEAFSD
jgi:hypothetical protein